ncbi:MAG: MoaD family protein [Candidatus Odinarchaeota archaeon]
MQVSCYFFGRIAKIVGKKHLEVQLVGETIGDLVKELCKNYPELTDVLITAQGELSVQVNILVNGHSVRLLKGIETPLRAIDEVKIDRIDILETIGGGIGWEADHSLYGI